MRKRIFEIIEVSKSGDIASAIYDYFMMAVILVSMIPLGFKETNVPFLLIDKITALIFVVDYALRLLTADMKLQKESFSFLAYPFTFMALIDLVSILPSFTVLSSGFRAFKIFRLFRTFRVFRAFKMARYSKKHHYHLERHPLPAGATHGCLYACISLCPHRCAGHL